MILQDSEIRRLSVDSPLDVQLIRPFDEENLQPASYDLRLSRKFSIYGEEVDVASLYLPPFTFALGCTAERISIPPWIAAQVMGKSGPARKGLQVEAAGFVNPGYTGVLTLELLNVGPTPLLLSEGLLVAQIVFFELVGTCQNPYSAARNAYQDSDGPGL